MKKLLSENIIRQRSGLAIVLLGCVVVMPAPVHGAELGRLFFSPQQRQDLDRRRATNAQAAVVTADDLVTVNGYVSRSTGGKTTTWINGAPQDDLHHSNNAGRITIKQGDESPTITLKVGETMDRIKGETRDRLDGGTVSVKPSGAKK